MKKLLISTLVIATLFTIGTTVVKATEESSVEDTLALCSDNVDNDGDMLVDLIDPNCSAFIPAPVEDTLALCSDNVDNDGDMLVDLIDPNCSAFVPPVATTTPPAVVSGGGAGNAGGSTGGSSNITSGTPISATGTSTATSTFDTTGINLMCSDLIATYMGHGKKNISADVIKLQNFLNKELGLKLKVDGKFGQITLNAVKKFQAKYSSTTLLPWDQAGVSKNLVSRPTGYVYKTTLRQINLLLCPSTVIPMPELK